MKRNPLRLTVFSRHPSHNTLRQARVILPVPVSLRLGSTTVGRTRYAVQLNSPQAVTISANKLLMKRAFTEAGVKTADWWTLEDILTDSGNYNFWCNPAGKKEGGDYHAKLPYPIVAKSLFGSRGTGNRLIKSAKELEDFMVGKNFLNYIFERFYSYSREYRLHVSATGCFYTCRKMLKSDTPADKRWYRNDSNSVWVMENNPDFNKPASWDAIVANCVTALKAVGLDLAAFDVKVQGKDKSDFIIIESNSAPSFGEVTLQKYVEEIPKIVNLKLQTK